MQADDYLAIAGQLFSSPKDEVALLPLLCQLPDLTESLLETLAVESEKYAYSQPRLGWAISRIADLAAAYQKKDLRMQSLSAWYLARAANYWVRPDLVAPALQQARRGFVELKDPAWIAACDWQANELSWTKGNLALSARILEKAWATLEAASLRDFAPQCLLSLARNQSYVNLEAAQSTLLLCKIYFSKKNDEFALAQCSFLEGVIFFIQNHFEQAQQSLENTAEIFKRLEKTTFLARTLYQIALNYLFSTTDIQSTVSYFKKADELFSQCDLELWHGVCQNYLGMTVIQDGQLERAQHCFAEAARIFQRYQVPFLLADAYHSSGLFNLTKGNLQESISQLKIAVQLNKRVGRLSTAAIETGLLGKAYCLSGRYQDGIYHLEKTIEALLPLQNTLVLSDCEAYLASAWFYLRNIPLSLDHAQTAESLFQQNHQNASITTLSNLKASIYFEQNDLEKTLSSLKESLDRSLKFKLRPQAALAHRLIGQVLLRKGEFSTAQKHLQTSLESFREMQMSLEEAASLISLGDYYASTDDLSRSEDCFSSALELSSGAFDEIDWYAYAGLAGIAEKSDNLPEALNKYRQSIESISKIRNNFWQAGLAGSFGNKPAEVFARAIPLAVQIFSDEDAVNFIEADKANSLINQLNQPLKPNRSKTSHEIDALKSEIVWLQEQMKVSASSQNSLKTELQNRQFRQKLVEKSKKYDEMNSHFERKLNHSRLTNFSQGFDLQFFCSCIEANSGNNWVALDYYYTGDQLFIACITSQRIRVFKKKIPARASMALETCHYSQQNGLPPEPQELRILGELLIPEEIIGEIQADTQLILSPHDQLGGIPWNALQPTAEKRSLVEYCVPVVVPSLRSAAILWSSSSRQAALARQKGLVVGISDFSGSHPELPFVREEVAEFSSILDYGGRILPEKEATWNELLRASRPDPKHGLPNYRFLHIASHFFSDSISGRLSGIALHGEDIYQDQLRELAPLPELVTLSGCSSIFSLSYPGDEQVGLPTTCLISGAKSIIGSNWPILDRSSADFMSVFYRNYFSGLSPADALAQTQREFIRNREETASWAGYSCIGKG
jgi:CHAT domain-containing protein